VKIVIQFFSEDDDTDGALIQLEGRTISMSGVDVIDMSASVDMGFDGEKRVPLATGNLKLYASGLRAIWS